MDESIRINSSRELLTTARFDVVELEANIPNVGVIRKSMIRHRGSVAILPCAAPDEVCLIRNYRLSANDWLWEIPAGTLEKDEPPQACAVRELGEETGCSAASWKAIGSFYVSPGIMTERMHLFAAYGLTFGTPALEPGELITVHRFKLSTAMQMIERGDIVDAKTIIALYWQSAHATG